MKVLLPANTGQLGEKEKWFKSDVCAKLKEKGVEFGFEIKGLIGDDGVKTDFPFGVHLPYDFVNLMHKGETCNRAKSLICQIEDLNPRPLYVILHGMKLENNREPLSRERRYVSRFGAEEYDDAFNYTVGICQDLMKFFGPSVKVAIENTPFTDIYQPLVDIFQGDNNKPIALETCLCLRVGNLNDSLLALKQEASCDIALDFEHLLFAHDFARRYGLYSGLKAEIPQDISVEEGELIKKCGLFLRRGFIPVVPAPFGILEEEAECIGADIYHFSGSCSCGKWEEICGGKIAHHSPILPGDNNVMRMLKFLKRIQSDKDLSFVLEVCGSGDIPKYPKLWTTPRSANAQRESFDVFCQMLMEIWYK